MLEKISGVVSSQEPTTDTTSACCRMVISQSDQEYVRLMSNTAACLGYKSKVSATRKAAPNDFIDISMFNIAAGKSGVQLL